MTKLYLYYKKLIVFLFKHNIVRDKCKLLECIDLNLYDPKWEFIEHNFILNNIIEEIDFLKKINSLNLESERIDVTIKRKITTFNIWYSNNGYRIDLNHFYIWLNEVKKILKLHNGMKLNNNILQYNHMKIKAIQNEYSVLINKMVTILKL